MKCAGPKTGSAGGRCNPAMAGNIPAHAGGYGYVRGQAFRHGFRGGYGPGAGRCRGGGRGYGWTPPAAGPAYRPAYSMDASREMDMLKADADYLKKSLDAVNKRIEELDDKPSD